MTTLVNTNDYEKGGNPHTMTTNDLVVQVKFHGGDEALAKDRKNLRGTPTVVVKIKLPNPPANSDGIETDFSAVKVINDEDACFRLNVPTGTQVLCDVVGNTIGRRVRVWGVEA